MTDILISNSELSAWARCPRRWLVSYYWGYVPADERPYGHRLLGTRIHLAMEARSGYGLNPLDVLNLLYRIEMDEHPEHEHELHKELELAVIMVSGCLEYLAAEAVEADWELIATEHEVAVPFIPGVQLRGKLDQLVRQISTGLVCFRDWKTSDNFARHEMLEMDRQFRRYCLIQALKAAANKETPARGGLVTTMRRVKRSGQSQPPYYKTSDFRYNDEIMSAAWYEAAQLCGEIITARAALDASRSRGDGLAELNRLQRTLLRPVYIDTDCRWSCDAPGREGCLSMDDGSDWLAMLSSSGRWRQEDPYAYYDAQDAIATIRDKLARL